MSCRDDNVHNREWCAGKTKEDISMQQGTEGRIRIKQSCSHIPHSITASHMTTEDIKCHNIKDNIYSLKCLLKNLLRNFNLHAGITDTVEMALLKEG